MSETVLNGRYALVAQQGSGGMSVIYKAIDRALGRSVAIKILRPSLTRDPSFLEKFRNEARAVANLSHPNIVTVHDVGSDGPTHYIVMEMVEGRDLKKIIKEHGGPLPVNRVLEIGIQICAGIGYAHRSGLVHADVKPQNVLITPDDVVKVTDFGIAQALTDTQPVEKADVVWGSPHYFAPEQAKGERPTPAADVYAIGIVLFEMLTGELPYTGNNQQELALAHIRERVPMVTERNPKVPESLARTVHKVMSKHPNERYREADQLGNILQKFQDRSQDNTMMSAKVPPPIKTRSQQPPPANRPPGIGIPPAPSGRSQPAPPPNASNEEATARYSAAPNAPRPYHPRNAYQKSQQAPSASAPAPTQQPAPYTPPAPQGTQYGNTGFYNTQQYSRPMPTESDDRPDYATIALAVLAIIAVLGLIPLYFVIIIAR